jgi:hypothetical protein
MEQQTLLLVGIVAIAALMLIAVAFGLAARRRSRLREHFGPEYERVVSEAGDQGRADRILAQRERRVKKLDIRPLPESARAQLVERWRAVQARFVDDPRDAVGDADALIGDAMQARGYPVGDFEQRAADVSVEHPRVVTDYRTAHDIARRREVDTEDLRRAMVHYRSLFEALVSAEPREDEERIEEPEESDR